MLQHNKTHLSIRIIGKVQGVWYRKNGCEEADRLQLAGTVRNMPDGSVLIKAEGLRTDLDVLVAWCQHGPPIAEVQDVQVEGGRL